MILININKNIRLSIITSRRERSDVEEIKKNIHGKNKNPLRKISYTFI